MKTLLPALCCLLASAPGFSQNWNLAAPARTYNFGAAPDASLVAKTIAVESTEILGADSIFRAGPRTLQYFSSYPYVEWTGNLLADSIVQKPGGRFEFHYLPSLGSIGPVPSSFFLESRAEPGESWVFQDSLTAQVLNVAPQTLWGISDSVKTIGLSNGDSILISRAFGFLRFRNFSLIGLEGAGIGVQLPDNLSWYDWAPGEIFQYEIFSGNNYDLNYKTWTKLKVLSKTVTPQVITFSVRRLTKRESYNVFGLTSTVYEDVVEPLVIAGPEQVDFPGYEAFMSNCAFRTCHYEQSGSGMVKVREQVLPPCSSAPQLTERYETGLGRTKYYFNYNAPGGGQKTDERLIGHQKTGQSPQGTVYPNSFYNAVSEVDDPAEDSGLRVFPNPARDRVSISCPGCGKLTRIDVFNAAGQRVDSATPAESLPLLPVGHLPAGLYWLRVETDKGVRSGKLLLER